MFTPEEGRALERMERAKDDPLNSVANLKSHGVAHKKAAFAKFGPHMDRDALQVGSFAVLESA
jgi:hypothetical protein